MALPFLARGGRTLKVLPYRRLGVRARPAVPQGFQPPTDPTLTISLTFC